MASFPTGMSSPDTRGLCSDKCPSAQTPSATCQDAFFSFKPLNPGLQVRFRHVPAKALSFQPGSAAGKRFHVGAASADPAASGSTERNHRNPFKAVFLDKCVQDARLFAPPDGKAQIDGRIAFQGDLLASDLRTNVLSFCSFVERLLLSL